MIRLSDLMFRQIDKLILYQMSQRIPATLEPSCQTVTPFETIWQEAYLEPIETAVFPLTNPGEHALFLYTAGERHPCHIRVQPTQDPMAPLVIYHHGLNEYPYTSSWRRIFFNFHLPYHLVCVQAPFHDNWFDPITKGFATVTRLYQLLAGSLNLIDLVREQFEAKGASRTIVVGPSWGGLVTLLYEALYQNTFAVIPMLASPDLAQVMMDSAALFKRDVAVPASEVSKLLDFTSYYRQVDPNKIYPLLGQNDMFFRYQHHAIIYEQRPLATVPTGHITTMWPGIGLRRHVVGLLEMFLADQGAGQGAAKR